MKFSKLQKIIFISIIVIVVLLAGSFTALSIASYKPTIAFYNVNEKVQAALEKEMESMPTKKSKKKSNTKIETRRFNYVVLDNTIPLSKQTKAVKKAKIVFATLDFDVRDYAIKNKSVRPQSVNLLEGMPSTTRQTAIASGEKLFVVPLLYDFYELDVNRPVFNESNIENISVWDDLEAFFADTYNGESPFSFAGASDDELIDFVGCVTEALEGTAKLEDAQNQLYEAAKKGNLENLKDVISTLCEDEAQPLYTAINKIDELYKNKYLNVSFLDFQKRDKLFFIENHIINSTFLKLSEHRGIDSSVINEFSSIYILGKDTSSSRTFSAPTIVGIAQSKKDYVGEALLLLSSSHQMNLSFATGLAPVQANCGTPDRQADDVRFWIAASSGPNIPLSAALPSTEMKKVVADYIRGKVRY